MMSCFEEFADDTELLEGGEDQDRYSSTTRCNSVRLSSIFGLISTSAKQFRVLHAMKGRSKLSSIGCYSVATIAKYGPIGCAVNLQKVSEQLDRAWTFSIAMDMSTLMSALYLDVRI